VTAASGYLTKDVRARKNLVIKTQSTASRVLLDGTKAVGVKYIGKDEKTYTVSLASSSGEVRSRRLCRVEESIL
jgi:choline dehydrogenase-like flavoprotein